MKITMFRRILICGVCLTSAWGVLASNTSLPVIAEGIWDLPGEESILSDEDKNQVSEVLRLKRTFGEDVWPGIADLVVPILIYNEEWQFLIGHPHSPLPSWEEVGNDRFQGDAYYRKPAVDTQAFAVPVGDLWAASLNGLESMNREMEKLVRERIKDREVTPAMLKMFLQTPGQHAAALLHEAFHAFQAMRFPVRFERARSAYSFEKDYPFENEAFGNAWDEEGHLLAKAYALKDENEMRSLVRQFLEHREKRRMSADLAPELRAFERDLEWLEGLGKYAEMRFAELASRETQDEESAKGYRIAFNRARADMRSRLSRLGEQSGDLRFYLSGAVQAMLLDRLYPDWKVEFKDTRVSLEELLAGAVD